MTDNNNLPEAIDNYLEGTASEEEKILVNNWYESFDDKVAVVPVSRENYRDIVNERLQQRINASTGTTFTKMEAPVKKMAYLRYAAACAAILLIVGAAFLYQSNNGDKENQLHTLAIDLKPGENRAMLTLANGRNIRLNHASKGIIGTENNIQIKNTTAGQVEYLLEGLSTESQPGYNTLTTPNGGQYQLKLADGTLVWLNAGSSLKYPVSFTGTERRVHLSGEAYFEVAKNKLKPFKVEYAGQIVEVLGTHFNIRAYADGKPAQTSLLEGLVSVTHGTDRIRLRPGQQSIINATSGKLTKHLIPDTDAIIGWKNGTFNFDSADIKTIMEEFSRWYDVQVVFNGPAPDYHLSGTYKRDINGATLLKVFKLTGLKYNLEGHKIIISK